MFKTLAVAIGLSLLAFAPANAANISGRQPVRASVIAPSSPVLTGVVTGAIIGTVVAAVACGPAAAVCAIGTHTLTTGGAILVGAGIGAGTGLVVATVVPTMWGRDQYY